MSAKSGNTTAAKPAEAQKERAKNDFSASRGFAKNKQEANMRAGRAIKRDTRNQTTESVPCTAPWARSHVH